MSKQEISFNTLKNLRNVDKKAHIDTYLYCCECDECQKHYDEYNNSLFE